MDKLVRWLWQLESGGNATKMRSHGGGGGGDALPLDVKVSHLFVTVCVGYITLLIITAAILWYVIHVYQRSYARAIADELYRKSFNIEKDLQVYRSQRMKKRSSNNLQPVPSTVNRSRLTLPENISRRMMAPKASTESQTEGNQQVDTMFQRMLQYRLKDKKIDKFLSGPNNRSILCANSYDFMKKI